MICVKQIADGYRNKREISDEDARNFVRMVEHGLSIDSVIEIMGGKRCTYSNSDSVFSRRGWYLSKLIRNETVRQSALFCALLGVKQIVLAGFNDVKFDGMKDAKIWLELHGYSRLTKSQYRDCVQAWIKKESVAKVQSLPSGKFLVQEFKIV
jgi:hypothetical protein